jgi:hypothetical protein
MTCRIDRVQTRQGPVLCVSGRITTEDVPVIRNALVGGRVIAVELAEIELVNREAVRLLAQAEANGIELRGCPAYIREWISRERRDD